MREGGYKAFMLEEQDDFDEAACISASIDGAELFAGKYAKKLGLCQ